VESESSDYNRFGLEQLPDPVPGHSGPLGGLLAALRRLSQDAVTEWLLLVPCDAPFVPADLGQRLLEHANAAGSDGAVVIANGELQPAFSLWNRSITPEIERAVLGEGMAGFKQFLRLRPLVELRWKGNDPETGAQPFFNINDRDTLDRAQQFFMNPAENDRCSV
jgi:molybdopterin-guanine dinucleotide biosynthesis protein A